MIEALLKEWQNNRKWAARVEEAIEMVNMRLPLLSAEPRRVNVSERWVESIIKRIPQVTLFFPYDKTSIDSLERIFFLNRWKQLESKMVPDYADYISEYLSPDEQVIVRLWFESNVEGATCKRVEIGSKDILYTKHYYEVVCADAVVEE